MVIIASGTARGRVRTTATTIDDDDGVAQHGGHTPNNRLTETCSLGLPCTSLRLEHFATRALSYGVAGQNFIVSRNICYKCWRSEIEFQVSPTVQMHLLENVCQIQVNT